MKHCLIIMLLALSSCAHQTKAKDAAQSETPSSTSKDQLRRACWKGVKQGCGKNIRCYDRIGDYCEKEENLKF